MLVRVRSAKAPQQCQIPHATLGARDKAYLLLELHLDICRNAFIIIGAPFLSLSPYWIKRED